MTQNNEMDTFRSYKCNYCKDSGWDYERRSDGRDWAIPCPNCKGGRYQRVETVRQESALPKIYKDKYIDSFKWNIYTKPNGEPYNLQQVQKVVSNFLDNFNQWEREKTGLYIHSKIKGTGKTFLASCLSNELMKRNAIKTKFVSASNLLNIAQSGNKNSSDQYERDPIALLCNCKLLVLDDLGQNALPFGSQAEQYFSNVLFRIIDERYNNGLVSIITSNVEPSELPLRDATVDRIADNTIQIPLPNCCVRSSESNTRKRAFLQRQGIL